MFTEKFNNCVCHGDTISTELEGFTFTAKVEADSDSKPENCDCYSKEDIKRFYDDNWFYCGVVVTASKNSIELASDSVWAVDCNFGENNDYLTDVANDLIMETLPAAKAAIQGLLK